MNIFKKISEFFSTLLGSQSKETELSERDFMEKQRKSMKRIKSNLTELIFQRKKLESQVYNLKNEALHISEDLETAAMQDKDDVALYLMERQEDVDKESILLQGHLIKVVDEIQKTKMLESSLAAQIDKSRIQFAVLKSRKEALSLRKRLQQDLSSVSNSELPGMVGLNQVEEEILRMEATIESLDTSDSDLQLEVRELRRSKTDAVKQSRLIQLKEHLRRRQLPETIEVDAKQFVREVVGIQ